MSVTKTELTAELNLQSAADLTAVQQQLNHSNAEASSLNDVEATEVRRYVQGLRAGLTPQEAASQAKVTNVTQLQSGESLHPVTEPNHRQSAPVKPTERIEKIIQSQQALTRTLLELSHTQAELTEAKAWTQFQSTYATKLCNDINKFGDDMTALFSLMNSNLEEAEFIATEEYQPVPFDSNPKMSVYRLKSTL
jgi:hypothetical protein